MDIFKILDFKLTDNYFEIIENIGNLLNINWNDERMSLIINLIDEILILDDLTENKIKDSIKFWLDFLNEEQINQVYNFIKNNYLKIFYELRESKEEVELKEEKEELTEENKIESFEEKEKRYFEMMKPIIELSESKLEIKPKEYKTISYKLQTESEIQPKEEIKKETEEKIVDLKSKEKIKKEEILPEGVVIIKKAKEEIKKENDNLLDLSEL